MLNKPATFWGKLRTTEDGIAWHPLADHCADVAAVLEALLRLPVWRNRLNRLAGRELTEICWIRLCVLGALHDIGKFNLGFQAHGRPELGPTAGHVAEAVAALFQPVCGSLSALTDWGDNVTALMIAALCHHGRPHGCDQAAAAWRLTHWHAREGLDPKAGIDDLLERCRRWFPEAFARHDAALPESPAFAHAFAGAVMLADWIGSDMRFFPFTRDGDPDRMEFARRQARDALRNMSIDIELTTRQDASQRDPFARVTRPDYAPRPSQAAMLALPTDPDGSITVLEAETGSGKTEAALARFVALFEAGLVDGLYFALPTRSAAMQIHRRVYEAVQRAFQAPPPVILAVPGYLRVDDTEGTKLAPFEVLWTDAPNERWRYRAWAAENTKRYLAGAIVVGTIDQVLLSSLMVGHAHLRATALLRHLLVVDEVHASDAYMGRILEAVLTRHRSAGGHALLLSATLGGEARTRLLNPGTPSRDLSLIEAESTPYPLVSHRGSVDAAIDTTGADTGRTIDMNVRPWIDHPSAIAAESIAAALCGAKVLVIRNTVTDCVATQSAVEREGDRHGERDVLFACRDVPAPHHARFARADREALDRALERSLGRDRREGGCVVVATQTVQQSLDLDADVLFTDICPADVLLQRIGRLHRHSRQRPLGFERPRAFVLVPTERDLGTLISESGHVRSRHGLGFVYEDLRILEATWRLMESHPEWQIPEMNRLLVERSVHSSVLDAIAEEGGARWRAHAVQVLGAKRGETRLADLNVVDWSSSYAEMSFPSGTEQRIPTRLGENDRRMRFRIPVASPFGEQIDEVTARASWVAGVPPEELYAQCETDHEGKLTLVFGGRRFTYDRLGLRPESSASKEVDEDDGP